MKVILGVLKEEEDRLKALLKVYEKEIAERPKGSISVKILGKKRYAYLNFREGDKVKTRYLGVEHAKQVAAMRKVIEERRRYERWLREVKQNLRLLHRVLHARRKG
jgi:hypothetical protein